ncbi:uncharacterized protein LOC128952395 [Oppia nitens]|uniref:uncharacterized protein LOC128952395 n=1 Tax=Oppia nitens TaxID=1686743 RepID=UPI0023DB8238|nr:uncharacterized protein LOC128952395 [Oppia nitens]
MLADVHLIDRPIGTIYNYLIAYYKLLKESKPTKIDTLKQFERYLQSPLIGVLSVTFEEYANRRVDDNNKPTVWPLIGDPFYMTGNRMLFNLVLASIALNASAMRTIFLIAERRHNLEFLNDLYCLQTGCKHSLNKQSLQKMNNRCILSYQLMLKQIPLNALLLFSLIYGYYTITAIQKQDYNYTVAVSLVWFVLTSLAAWVAASMQGISYSLLYLSQYYLSMRFAQIDNHITHEWKCHFRQLLLKFLNNHNHIASLYSLFRKR